MATGTTRRALRLSVQGQFLTALLGLPLSLLAIPLTLRHVSLSDYGSYASLTAALALVGLSEAGVSVEVTRRIAAAAGAQDEPALRRAVREGTTLLGLIGLGLTVVGLAVTPTIIDFAFPTATAHEHHRLTVVLVATVVQIGLGLPLAGYFAVLQGLQRTDYSAYLGLALRLVGLALLVVLADAGLGLYALWLSGTVVTVLGWLGSFVAVQRVRPGLFPSVTRPRARTLLPYFGVSLVIVSASVSNIFDNQFDKVVLSHFSGPARAGDYQIGTTLSLAAQSLTLAPIGLLLAGAAELRTRDPERLERLHRLMTRGTYALGAFLLLGTATYASDFVPLWLGATYPGAARATSVLCLALMFNLWSAPLYYYALGHGWLRETAYSALSNAVTNATSSFLLTRALGLDGALAGSLIGNAVGLTTFWLILRRRESRPWLRPVVRPTVVVAVTALLGLVAERNLPTSRLSLAAQLLVWSVTTAGLLWATGCVPLRLQRRATLPYVWPVVDESEAAPVSRLARR